MEKDVYIFTEMVNCGKIGKVALDSFHKYHDLPVHVYGTKKDFALLTAHPNNIFHDVPAQVTEKFGQGHLGTAALWEAVIRQQTGPYLIHFDSDVVFRQDLLSIMIERSGEFDLIGPRRCYHHNPNGRNDVRHLVDVVQTCCFLFNKQRISAGHAPFWQSLRTQSLVQAIRQQRQLHELRKNRIAVLAAMIRGTFMPLGFPTIDFFDPVAFDMIKNGARIHYLNHDDVGGCDFYGSRDNAFAQLNNFPTPYKIDYGSKLAHFSCVGSGMNFHRHPDRIWNVDQRYITCAMDRYALFCKIFYDEDLPGFDLSKYKALLELKKWY